MSSLYGITRNGFVTKRQPEILGEIKSALQAAFGGGVNLSAETALGGLAAIFSEREALLWELAAAVYYSQFPDGAEGLSVDNLLALNNLSRLPASPAVTDPTPVLQSNGITLYGLLLSGTPGTLIPKGALIRSTTTPQQTYTLDVDAVISSPVNAKQSVVLSNVPSSGVFTLGVEQGGSELQTGSIPFDALANVTLLKWPVAPSSGYFSLILGDLYASSSFAFNASIATIQQGLRTAAQSAGLPNYASILVTGSFASGLSIDWGSAQYNPSVQVSGTVVSYGASLVSGSYCLQIDGLTSPPIAAPGGVDEIEVALAQMGHNAVVIETPTPNNRVIFWGVSAPGSVSITNNTTSAAVTTLAATTLNQPTSIRQSIQSFINGIESSGIKPFSDVAVAGSSTIYSLSFGSNAPLSGQPSTAGRAIPAFEVQSNTMMQGGSVTNVAVAVGTSGAPAQAVVSATSTQNGPNSLIAGQLSVIGSPVAGWSGVTNELDTLAGSNVESDAEALTRRSELLSSQANGPLQSIVQKVSQIGGVQTAIGFANQTAAALQTLQFSPLPSSGSYALILSTGVTATIAYSADSGAVQSAINAVAGFQNVQVTGSVVFGFSIDFAGSQGGQAQPLIGVSSNSTMVTITPSFGRPPKSFEIVVDGGNPTEIAETIYRSMPAGIASYGTPAARTTGSPNAGSTAMSVAAGTGILPGQSIFGLGIAAGTTVVSISGTSLTVSIPAIGSYVSTPLLFDAAVQILDSYGTPRVINFSRPVPILFYVTISLVTDQYRTPGVPASGVNPASKFSPGTISKIQQDVVDIGNKTPIGGLVVGFGTSGLIGAFNSVPGILGYQLRFGANPGPTLSDNIQLLPTQVAAFQVFNVAVTYV